MNLEDINILSAMGLPGGGRSVITARVMRHFNIIAYTELEDLMIKSIFNQLVSCFLYKFSEEIRDMVPKLIDSVLVVYERVKRELLPTPKKSHYTFNLRDISKVFQGVCSASVKFCNSIPQIMKLWYHENMRIFHDRLIDEEDRQEMKKILIEQFQPFFNQDKETILNLERIIFGDYFQSRDAEPRHY